MTCPIICPLSPLLCNGRTLFLPFLLLRGSCRGNELLNTISRTAKSRRCFSFIITPLCVNSDCVFRAILPTAAGNNAKAQLSIATSSNNTCRCRPHRIHGLDIAKFEDRFEHIDQIRRRPERHRSKVLPGGYPRTGSEDDPRRRIAHSSAGIVQIERDAHQGLSLGGLEDGGRVAQLEGNAHIGGGPNGATLQFERQSARAIVQRDYVDARCRGTGRGEGGIGSGREGHNIVRIQDIVEASGAPSFQSPPRRLPSHRK